MLCWDTKGVESVVAVMVTAVELFQVWVKGLLQLASLLCTSAAFIPVQWFLSYKFYRCTRLCESYRMDKLGQNVVIIFLPASERGCWLWESSAPSLLTWFAPLQSLTSSHTWKSLENPSGLSRPQCFKCDISEADPSVVSSELINHPLLFFGKLISANNAGWLYRSGFSWRFWHSGN